MPNTLHFPFLPPAFIAEHDVTCYGIFCSSLEVSCPSYIPSQRLGHP